MVVLWELSTNAKSVKNAQVLLNIITRHLSVPVSKVQINGDRYSGHQICFELQYPIRDDNAVAGRAQSLYQLLSEAEQLANSWTLSSISAPAAGWSNRARISGVTRISWREQLSGDTEARNWRSRSTKG